MDLVSIIIPTYNRAHLIGETLDSLIAQTYQNWECIIVDDGSTDNTEELINKYKATDSRFQFFHRPDNRPKGGNACRNYGFEKSKGDFINWLDSDDLLLPHHIQVHINARIKNDVDAIISGASCFLRSSTNIVGKWNVTVRRAIIDEMIFNHVLWPINCVSWKRKSVPDFPFDEILTSSQEWTFHLKQLIAKKTYQTLNYETCLIRQHDARIGKIISEKKNYSTFKSRKDVLALLRKNKMISNTMEKGLLNIIFLAFRLSIQQNQFKLVAKIVLFLLQEIKKSSQKKHILKVLLIALPIYMCTKKGEILFKIT